MVEAQTLKVDSPDVQEIEVNIHGSFSLQVEMTLFAPYPKAEWSIAIRILHRPACAKAQVH